MTHEPETVVGLDGLEYRLEKVTERNLHPGTRVFGRDTRRGCEYEVVQVFNVRRNTFEARMRLLADPLHSYSRETLVGQTFSDHFHREWYRVGIEETDPW